MNESEAFNSATALDLGLGIAVALGVIVVAVALFKAMTVSVEDEHAVLITRFGKLVARLDRPGLHFVLDKVMPWVSVHHVSLARDFREFKNVHVNDARGTTVVVDVWVELRVVDPVKALFAVESWDTAVRNLLMHATTAALSHRDFSHILRDNNELTDTLKRELSIETERWGVRFEQVFLRDVSLLPEVSRQLFGAVAARLERARAVIEELGRLDVARLEADTAQKVAALVGEAKSQYPLAVGRAFNSMKAKPRVLEAYNTLFGLAQLRPHRTVAFRGFANGEMRSADAAMLAPELPMTGRPEVVSGPVSNAGPFTSGRRGPGAR